MKKTILILVLFLALSMSCIAQNPKIQAMFIYNFTKLIDWPAEYKSGNFVIGVLGGGQIYTEISAIAGSKTVGTQAIQTVTYPSPGAIGKCNILYVPATQTGNMTAIKALLAGKGTLIITEKEGATAQGSCINFVVRNNKQAFELSQAAIAAQNLKVSSQLTSLAILK